MITISTFFTKTAAKPSKDSEYLIQLRKTHRLGCEVAQVIASYIEPDENGVQWIHHDDICAAIRECVATGLLPKAPANPYATDIYDVAHREIPRNVRVRGTPDDCYPFVFTGQIERRKVNGVERY